MVRFRKQECLQRCKMLFLPASMVLVTHRNLTQNVEKMRIQFVGSLMISITGVEYMENKQKLRVNLKRYKISFSPINKFCIPSTHAWHCSESAAWKWMHWYFHLWCLDFFAKWTLKYWLGNSSISFTILFLLSLCS